MTRANAISFLLAIPLLASAARAQKADWRAVQHLPGGSRLKIKLRHGHSFGPYDFLGATEETLTCDYGGLLGDARPQYSRDNIKAMYLVHNFKPSGLKLERDLGPFWAR